MTIQDVHNSIKVLKSQAKGMGTHHSPAEIDLMIHNAQIDKYNEEKKMYLKTRAITDNLRQFLNESTISLTLGIGSLPSGYDLLLTVSDSTGKEIDIVEMSEWVARNNSDIEAPSVNYPICRVKGAQLVVKPTSVASAIVNYFKTPVPPVWGYTVSGNKYIYNSATSTQLEWPESAYNDIILRTCSYLGIPIDDTDLVQLKSFKKQTENV